MLIKYINLRDNTSSFNGFISYFPTINLTTLLSDELCILEITDKYFNVDKQTDISRLQAERCAILYLKEYHLTFSFYNKKTASRSKYQLV